jgi:hypothetical protein
MNSKKMLLKGKNEFKGNALEEKDGFKKRVLAGRSKIENIF